MNFPGVFRARYQALNRLSLRSDGRGSSWLVQRRDSPDLYVLKIQPLSHAPDTRVLEILRDRSLHANLLAPIEFGTEEGWHYQLFNHIPCNSLEDMLSRSELNTSRCHDFIQQIHAALCALHAEHIVHGDIKPSNILVATGGSCWRYLLTDFDTAVLLEAGQREHRRRGYTPIYASPELIGTKMISMAGDYWALGMTLLRWLLGGHPLIMHNENEREVCGALTTTWQPPFSVIDNSRLRALIGGLMERFPAGRWGATEVGSWLNGDPGIVSAGLILANDPPCNEPFHFEDQSVASATDLARALLRRWHRLNDVGECDRLCDWLRTQLQRPDLANYLQGILGNDTLNDDLRLLDFCYELDTRLQLSNSAQF